MTSHFVPRALRNVGAGRSLIGLSAALCVGSLVLAARHAHGLPGRPADDGAYTLQRVYTKGEVDRYKMKAEVHSDGSAFNGATKIVINIVLKEQTRTVKDDGNAVLNDISEQASADLGDNNKTDLTAFLPAITQTRDRQSHILESKIEGGLPGAGDMVSQIANALRCFYPSKPVKIGDSWDIEYDDKKPTSTSKTKGKSTLLAIEAVGGMQTAKIRVVTDSSGEVEDPGSHEKAKVSSHLDQVGNMDIKTGKIVLMSAKTTFKGSSITDTQIEWKLSTGDDKDNAAPADKKDAGKSTTKSGGR